MVAVGEDLGLQRQEGAAGVDEVDAGEPVLRGDLLRAQVLLHGQREVRAALHGRVVRDDDALAALDRADAGDDPGGGRLAVVAVPGGERAELEERRARVEQPLDPLARGQLAAGSGGARRPRRGPPAATCGAVRLAQLATSASMRPRFAANAGLAAIDSRLEDRHGASVLVARPGRTVYGAPYKAIPRLLTESASRRSQAAASLRLGASCEATKREATMKRKAVRSRSSSRQRGARDRLGGGGSGDRRHARPDVLVGTAAGDQIYGKGGDDTIDGRAGGDLIRAGDGNDLVWGGDGNDIGRRAAPATTTCAATPATTRSTVTTATTASAAATDAMRSTAVPGDDVLYSRADDRAPDLRELRPRQRPGVHPRERHRGRLRGRELRHERRRRVRLGRRRTGPPGPWPSARHRDRSPGAVAECQAPTAAERRRGSGRAFRVPAALSRSDRTGRRGRP